LLGQFSTNLRYKTFAISAYFEKINDKLILKIALSKKRRACFSDLWRYSKKYNLPFQFSILGRISGGIVFTGLDSIDSAGTINALGSMDLQLQVG